LKIRNVEKQSASDYVTLCIIVVIWWWCAVCL